MEEVEVYGTTLLNDMGDVEIVWDSENEAAMEAIIEKKMKEGVRFFKLKPMFGGLYRKRARVKDINELKDRKVYVSDEDIEKLFSEGKVEFYRNPAVNTIETAGVAKTAKEVVRSRTVGVRALQGG